MLIGSNLTEMILSLFGLAITLKNVLLVCVSYGIIPLKLAWPLLQCCLQLSGNYL